MQATIRGHRFGIGRVEMALVGAALVATTIAAVAAVQLTREDNNTVVAGISAPAGSGPMKWRFAEMNELPVGAAPAGSVDAASLQLEMNRAEFSDWLKYQGSVDAASLQLEMDRADYLLWQQLQADTLNALPRGLDFDRMRFLEINQLPVPPDVIPSRYDDFRFREINRLPGEELVAPAVVIGSPS